MAPVVVGPTLVLGGSGFLGAHVVAAAGQDGIAASRTPGPRPSPRFERVDATDLKEIERLLEATHPARIVDCAALSSLADAERTPDLARALNVDLPRALARWCAERGVRFVHVSTDLVFGGSEPPPTGFREEAPPAPISEYGRSKAAGEAAVLEVFPDALVVRLPLLFGDSFGRARGASDSLLAALERGERPALFTDEWRTPLDVADAAAALVELATGDERGLLHVAGPGRRTRHEIGVAVLRARGLSDPEIAVRIRAATRDSLGMAAARPRDVSLDASRARGRLSTPLRGLREALSVRAV